MCCPGRDQLDLFSQMLILGLGIVDSPMVPKGVGEFCEVYSML